MFRVMDSLAIIHAVRDIGSADAWYSNVLRATCIFRKEHSSAKGQASRYAFGGAMLEPISSSNPRSNINRVCSRYGERLYSSAWLVDDLEGCSDRLRSLGIRIYSADGRLLLGTPDSNAIFTHPHDTFGAIEFALVSRHRSEDEISKLVTVPPGHSRFRIIYLVASVHEATEIYGTMLDAEIVDMVSIENVEYASAVVRLPSGHEVEFREPTSLESPLGMMLSQRGNGPYGVQFRFSPPPDLRDAFAYYGVRSYMAESGTLVLEPVDCHGVAFEFTGASE